MPNLLVAGNSTNGGTAISTDTSGTLNIVTGSGSGANAITIDASQNVVFANAISVAGNTTITGTLAVTGGVSGSITSGTAVSASGTSVTFTGIPSTAKRITVMMNGVSTNGSSVVQIQIGSGSVTTSGYLGGAALFLTSPAIGVTASTTGFAAEQSSGTVTSSSTRYGNIVIALQTGNTWVAAGNIISTGATWGGMTGGSLALSGTLDRVRITTVNGTDTFDAGTINILWE
jgi:hypothetical protein